MNRITCERCEYWKERTHASPSSLRTGYCTIRGFLITLPVDFCRLRQLKTEKGEKNRSE